MHSYEREKYKHCPLCREPEMRQTGEFNCTAHPLWREGLPSVIRWMQCLTCSHSFADGFFGDDALAFMFEQWQGAQVFAGAVRLEEQRYIAADMLDRIVALVPRSRSFGHPDFAFRALDVGFGSGALLTTMAEYGWQVWGLDKRPAAVAPLSERGFRVAVGGIEDTRRLFDVKADGFDLIVFADVLEHVPYPDRLLEQARSLVPHGGLLVSCPNADSTLWREMGLQNPYWRELEHFHNFGFERLRVLLKRCGFDVTSYTVSRRYRACMEVLAEAV
jgi:SAM-dependent methyltransferase